VSDIGDRNHGARADRDAVVAVRLQQSLVAAVDAWAEARHINRFDAMQQLVELGLNAAPPAGLHYAIKDDSLAIEREAISRLRGLLDPSLPPEERERRIRRLIEGPPEFSEQRIDLPRHQK
jgi:hypothetical protein